MNVLKERMLAMRSIIVLWAAILVCCSWDVSGETAKAKETEDAPEKNIALLNLSGAVKEEIMAHLKKYAERELRVKTEVVDEEMEEGLTLKKSVQKIGSQKKYQHSLAIAFYFAPDESSHIRIATNKLVAVVNTAEVRCDEKEKFRQRLERLTMRSAGTMVGLGFDPDPHCVMHSYETVEDLDSMGRNFSPPWQAKFRKAAKEMGLETISLSRHHKIPQLRNKI